eukprot:1242903-Amorphochlora_amoeboformis.AAC.1
MYNDSRVSLLVLKKCSKIVLNQTAPTSCSPSAFSPRHPPNRTVQRQHKSPLIRCSHRGSQRTITSLQRRFRTSKSVSSDPVDISGHLDSGFRVTKFNTCPSPVPLDTLV